MGQHHRDFDNDFELILYGPNPAKERRPFGADDVVVRWCAPILRRPRSFSFPSTRFHKLSMPSFSPSIQLGGANVYMSSKLWLRIADVVFFELGVCKYRPIRRESAISPSSYARVPPVSWRWKASKIDEDPAAAVVVNQRKRRRRI